MHLVRSDVKASGDHQPRFWRWNFFPALVLVIASAAPHLALIGLAAAVEDADDLPVIAQNNPVRPPEPLPAAWSISLSTEAGQPGTQVQMNGSGWWAGAPVELRWGSPDGPLLGEASPGVDRGPSPGMFTLTFTVPDAAAGIYDLWAVGGEPVPVGGPRVGNQTGAAATSMAGFRVEPATVRTSFVVVGTQPDAAPPAPLGPM